MPRTVRDAVYELLLAHPDTEVVSTHGSPTFKVGGKTFAYWSVNHHGDGRIALWLASPPGIQDQCVALKPEAYFIPPYVGPRGWIGIDLNQGLSWTEVCDRVAEAWEHCATPKALSNKGADLPCAAPDTPLRPEDINPMLSERGQQILGGLAKRCEQLPEATADDVSGSATWRAGKKVFVRGRNENDRLSLLFWVGAEQQSLMTEDPRYSLPVYYHASGWIELDVQDSVNWQEIEALLEGSYRHFALKRMIKALDEALPW